jgi:flagellar protein FliL
MAREKQQDAAKEGKKPSLLSVVLPIALITLIAAGGGFAFGSLMVVAKEKQVAASAQEHGEEAKPGEHGEVKIKEKPEENEAGAIVRQLTPIVTNLMAPKEAWIRLEAAIVLKSEAASKQDLIAVESGDKIMGYLRSVTLAQIDGPSGLLHLREDLNDLLAGPPDAPVRKVLISSMVVE